MEIKKINKELFMEENDFYDIKSLNMLMDNGTISGAEEGFMNGYLEA